MYKEKLCVDFDGVIHKYITKWTTADVIPDPPVDGSIEFITEAVKHFDVCIHSTRCGETGGIRAMIKWMRFWGFPTKDLFFTFVKPAAVMYIDDRGYHFTGKFPSIDYIQNFKTWLHNEKEWNEKC